VSNYKLVFIKEEGRVKNSPLIIFLLPGGSLLIPILADILERRKKGRGDTK
jgi:hypothetical protein